MKKLIGLLVLFPSLAVAQVSIGGTPSSTVQIGGNQPGVSSIQGQTGDFTLSGDGFGGCSTSSGVTTCTFNGGSGAVSSVTTDGNSGLPILSGGVLNIPSKFGGNVFSPPNFDSLVGAFTDSSGNVIQPVALGNGPTTFYVPHGATQLQLGVNDDLLTDQSGSWVISVNGTNYTVSSQAPPWVNTGGINSRYPINITSSTPPVIAAIGVEGTPVVVQWVSGTITDFALCGVPGTPSFDASGQANCAPSTDGSNVLPGFWVSTAPISVSAGGVLSINGSAGAFTFSGSGVSCSGTGCTFSGGSTSPGGTNGQIQYNNGGSFGGDTGFTTDGAGNETMKTLTTTGTVVGQGGTWDSTEGTAPTPAAGHDLLWGDSGSHCIKYSANGGAGTCLGAAGVTTLNSLAGGLSLTSTGGTVAITPSGSTINLEASGGTGASYTNVPGSASETTVSALNTKCGTGTLYATTPLSIATGGTVTCPVQFSKAGLWTIASGQTVTFSKPITTTDASPVQHFAGSGSVALAAQDANAEWFGAVGDGVYSAGTGTDNAVAFQKTIDSISVGNMVLQCATYKSASVVNVHARNNIGIKGCQTNSKGNTTGTVVFTTSASATIFDFAGTGTTQLTYMYHNYISDLDLKRTIQPTGTATNLSLSFMCGAFVNRVFSEDAVRGFYLKGFGNCGVGEINDSDAQIGFGSFTPNASVSYYGFYLDGSDPFASTILTRPGVGVGTVTGTPTIYGVYVTGSIISDLMVQGLQTEATSYGVYIDGSGGGGGFHESDLHFTDPILDNCKVACIYVTGTLPTNESTIEFGGGWAEASGGSYGIDIESSYGIAIHDMQIVPNGGMSTAGIYLHSSQLISVSDNHFFGGWAGFSNPSSSLILDGSSGVTVTGNNFQVNTTSITNVILKNTSVRNALSGNWIGGGGSSVTGISADATSSNNSFLNTNAIDTAYTTKISDSGSNNQLTAATAWGSITGTLSSQTDLQTALNAKAPTASPTFTGTPDASGATQFKLPVAASFASLANGECGYDSTNKNWHCWVNGADTLMLPLSGTFTSGHCGQPTLHGTTWLVDDAGGACGVSGGGSAFSAITSGTNTTAAMVVGSGGSMDVSGTGTINATKIGGITVTGTPSTGYVPTATSSSTATWQAAGSSFPAPTTVSGTGVTALSVTGCITSTYKDYQIRYNVTQASGSGQTDVIRFGLSGTYDSTAAHYLYQRTNGSAVSSSSAGIIPSLFSGDTNWNTNDRIVGTLILHDPLNAGTTPMVGEQTNTPKIGSNYYYIGGSIEYTTNNVDAVQITSTSGSATFTGTLTCQPLAQ